MDGHFFGLRTAHRPVQLEAFKVTSLARFRENHGKVLFPKIALAIGLTIIYVVRLRKAMIPFHAIWGLCWHNLFFKESFFFTSMRFSHDLSIPSIPVVFFIINNGNVLFFSKL